MADEPDMVERVADAIRDNIGAALPDGVTIDYDYAARAAIEAMREPTDAMQAAALDRSGMECWDHIDSRLMDAWQAAIDAALQKRGRG